MSFSLFMRTMKLIQICTLNIIKLQTLVTWQVLLILFSHCVFIAMGHLHVHMKLLCKNNRINLFKEWHVHIWDSYGGFIWYTAVPFVQLFSKGNMRLMAKGRPLHWRSASIAHASKILQLPWLIAAGAAEDKNIFYFCERLRQPHQSRLQRGNSTTHPVYRVNPPLMRQLWEKVQNIYLFEHQCKTPAG